MGGLNLEAGRMGLYVFFPICIFYYFGYVRLHMQACIPWALVQ